MSLTKRFIVSSLDGIPLSNPIRYERYYINDNIIDNQIRVQADNFILETKTKISDI